MSNEVTVIENVELVPFFTKGDAVDSVLAAIAAEARSHVPDVSTKKGRDAIKAMVTKVVKSKTYLESNGKELAAEYKEIPKKIDANRKKTKDFLTALQNEIRQPLTDWEDEQERIKAAQAAAEESARLAAEIEQAHEIALLMNDKLDRDLAEQKAELERQRIEQECIAAEQQALRDEQIRLEAQAAVELAAKQREEQIEKERLAAIEREEQAKRDAIASEERRKLEAEQYEQRRIEAEAKAKRDAEEAAKRAKQAEIKRQQDEAKRISDEQAKREANKKHIGSIRKQAKESLMAIGIDEEMALTIVMAIHNNQIANVKINY